MAKILLVDDDKNFTTATTKLLQQESHSVSIASTVKSARRELEGQSFDVMLVDITLPDGNGLELIESNGPKAVVITGHPSVQTAIRAVRGPVVDYLIKPLDTKVLRSTIASLEGTSRSSATGAREKQDAVAAIIGETPKIKEVKKMILEFGPEDIKILIHGESGTGKELVAQALHDARRPDAPFVPVNCGAIPTDLIESEFFGHEEGAFTGAKSVYAGVFERAGEGTVFLDEVSELSLDHQVALLRILETSSLQRVGGNKKISIKARIIAATNKELEGAVKAGRFRQDLYYRLMVLPINLPPLRERVDDLPLLADFFLAEFAQEHKTPVRLHKTVLDKLKAYHWPGNIRELKHTLLRAALHNRGKDVIESLPDKFDTPIDWNGDQDVLRPGMKIRDLERVLIFKTLEHFDGNRRQTSEALGISLKTLYNRLSSYETR